MPAPGRRPFAAAPIACPQPAPIINSGASVLPDVPLETEIDHEMNFMTHKKHTNWMGSRCERMAEML